MVYQAFFSFVSERACEIWFARNCSNPIWIKFSVYCKYFLMCFTLSMDNDPGICWEPALSCSSPKQNHKEILWFVNRYPFTADQKIAEPDWQVYLRDTAKTILLEQSPAKLMTVRTRLYELLVHGIPINIVFKVSL